MKFDRCAVSYILLLASGSKTFTTGFVSPSHQVFFNANNGGLGLKPIHAEAVADQDVAEVSTEKENYSSSFTAPLSQSGKWNLLQMFFIGRKRRIENDIIAFLCSYFGRGTRWCSSSGY